MITSLIIKRMKFYKLDHLIIQFHFNYKIVKEKSKMLINLLILLILIIQNSNYSTSFFEKIFSLLSLKFKINFSQNPYKMFQFNDDFEIT